MSARIMKNIVTVSVFGGLTIAANIKVHLNRHVHDSVSIETQYSRFPDTAKPQAPAGAGDA